VLLVGAGGLGGEVGEGLVRKGIGRIEVCDPDIVSLSNLNRQRFFKQDIYQNKAVCLARNLAREAPGDTTIVGRACAIEDAAAGLKRAAAIVCGVDNNHTRLFVAARALRADVPVVFLGVDELAEHGYVFVQEKASACLACAVPRVLVDIGEQRCSKAGAVKDILKVVAGLALYGVDSLLMPRRREWNYREVFLSGVIPDAVRTIARRPDCQLCGRVET
jgi:adenylyltransferase/sulfurtransferase